MLNGKNNGRKPNKAVLPQIQRHPAYYEDPYKNSILFSFKLKDKQDEMLKRLVYDSRADSFDFVKLSHE